MRIHSRSQSGWGAWQGPQGVGMKVAECGMPLREIRICHRFRSTPILNFLPLPRNNCARQKRSSDFRSPLCYVLSMLSLRMEVLGHDMALWGLWEDTHTILGPSLTL